MKLLKSILIILLVAVYLPTNKLEAAENVGYSHFTDVSSNDPNLQHIMDLVFAGVIKGMTENTFEPQSPLTREQFATLIVQAFKLTGEAKDLPFNDLTDWSKTYISIAYQNKLISGVSKDKFNPKGNVTRQEAAAIVWRYLQRQGVSAPIESTHLVQDASEWAREAVQGILTLNLRSDSASTYRSQENMLRGDAAALINLAIKYLENREYEPNDIQLKAGVIELDSSVEVIEISAEALVVTGDESELNKVKAGEIVVFPKSPSAPFGLVKIIEEIKVEEGKYIVKASDPEIEQFLESINVHGEVDLTTDNIIWLDDSPIQGPSDKEIAIRAFKPEASVKVSQGKIKFGIKAEAEGFSVKGDFSLIDPKVSFHIDYGFLSIEDIRLEFSAKHEANLAISFTEETELSFTIAKFAIVIPRTPCAIQFNIDLTVKADGSFHIKVSENGYFSVGFDNNGGFGNQVMNPFVDETDIEFGSMVETQTALKNVLYPQVFQVKLDFIGISQTLVGVSGKLTTKLNRSLCEEGSINLFTDASVFAKSNKLIKFKVEGEIYKVSKKLLDFSSCNKAGIQTIEPGAFYTYFVKGDGTVTAIPNESTEQISLHELKNVITIYDGAPSDDMFTSYPVYALNNDGSLWTWDNHVMETIVQPVSFKDKVRDVAVGAKHGLALMENGTVESWGANYAGQLGNGTISKLGNGSAKVIGLNDVIAIAAGENYSLPLKSDGTVWEWGYVGEHESNDGQYVLTPRQIADEARGISAYGYSAFLIKNDGSVWAWGSNEYGEMGTEREFTRYEPNLTPVKITGLSDIAVVKSGGSYALALDRMGNVWGWGDNYYGNLGDGTQKDSFIPVKAKVSNVISIYTRTWSSFAVDSKGKVWNWGWQSDRETFFSTPREWNL